MSKIRIIFFVTKDGCKDIALFPAEELPVANSC